MWKRFAKFLVAELIAFGALCFGGLAVLGAVMTSAGDSRHSALVSWILVALFGGIALVLGRLALRQFRRVFARAAMEPSPVAAPE